jgi:hypothetical protein
VTDDVHADFLAVCEALGRTPAAVLRKLVEGHVATHSIYLEDDVRVTVERPAGYDYGAWRVRMTLRSPAAMEFMGGPVPFRIPQLKERRICSDKGYRVAAVNWDGTGSGLDGIFVDGVWEGDVYSNGVAEDDNATSIDSVVAALKAAVRDQVQTRADHGQS